MPFRTEEALFAFMAKQRARTPAWLVLLDSRGEALSSEGLAAWLGARRDAGQQMIVFAIGPASGWSDRRAPASPDQAVPGADDAAPRAGPPGAGGTNLPGIYNTLWASVPHRTLKQCSQIDTHQRKLHAIWNREGCGSCKNAPVSFSDGLDGTGQR